MSRHNCEVIHEEMTQTKPVYVIQISLICTNFDFLVLHKMYPQNYFGIKLESFTSRRLCQADIHTTLVSVVYRVGNLAFLRPNNSILAFSFLVCS